MKSGKTQISSISLVTLASVALYVLMEWLFVSTKTSFMTAMSPGQRAGILAGTILAGVLFGGALVLPAQLLSRWARAERVHALVLDVARVPAALALGALGLLLVDNFTYTVWGWGIPRSAGLPQRSLYILLWLGITLWAYALVKRWTATDRVAGSSWSSAGQWLPPLCAFGAVILASGSLDTEARPNGVFGELARRPNIVLFSADGIDVAHVSAYGYSRSTTPTIDRLAPGSLFAENNFPNAAHTGASIASVLTGRLPTETGLIYPPDILRGADAHRHLPGLLKNQGYSTASITVRHYGDAFNLNLRGGFDESNFRDRGTYRLAWMLSGRLGQETTYLTEIMIDRLAARAVHLAGGRRMDEAFTEVALAGPERNNDSARIAGLIDFLNRAPRPFFVHIHLLATHGPQFANEVVEFSQGLGTQGGWEPAFYDDAILTIDGYFLRVWDGLRRLGIWDETLTVVFSDHGQRFFTEVRTPLLIRFPGDAHARRISDTTSNLDIAPTILDYLGAPAPEWMSGVSLLRADPGRLRPVLSSKKTKTGGEQTHAGWRLDPGSVGPPFYSLGSATAVICGRAFRLDLDNLRMRVAEVEGHTAPCGPRDLPNADDVEEMLVDHLRENGYDVSGLELPLPKRYSGIRRKDR
ncbi:MAG: sulfatase [Thermoanaerobaculia bacterium]